MRPLPLNYFRPAPKNEDEMMLAIFECIDRLFRIVRPRKLLYMAVDGVVRKIIYLKKNPFHFYFNYRRQEQR